MVRFTWQQATPPLLQPPIIRSIHSINLPRPTWWTTQDLHRDTFDTRAPDDDPLVCCAKEPLMTHAGLHRPKLHHHGTDIPGQYCNRTTQPRHPNHVYKRENTKACTAKYLWRSRRKKKRKKKKKETKTGREAPVLVMLFNTVWANTCRHQFKPPITLVRIKDCSFIPIPLPSCKKIKISPQKVKRNDTHFCSFFCSSFPPCVLFVFRAPLLDRAGQSENLRFAWQEKKWFA